MKKQNERDITIDKLTVVSAKFGIKKGRTKSGKEFASDDPTYQLSLKGNIPYEDIWAYDETSEKLTPAWFKKQDGYINLSTKFEVPVRRNGHEMSLSAWLENASEEDYSVNGSLIRIKIRQKDGAVYPVAIIVLEDGTPADPFEGME